MSEEPGPGPCSRDTVNMCQSSIPEYTNAEVYDASVPRARSYETCIGVSTTLRERISHLSGVGASVKPIEAYWPRQPSQSEVDDSRTQRRTLTGEIACVRTWS